MPNELSTLNYKILAQLSKGYTSKEDLVNTIWGYTYDPLRHDSLIYSTFSNLRKILKHDSRLIETSELGYNLNAQLVNLLETRKKEAANQKNQNFTPLKNELGSLLGLHLNSRQIQILQYLDNNQFISVKDAVLLFSTSEITANRDLRSLLAKNLVLRIGQGRATHYAKA